jgi:hypothetical protein
MTRGRSRAMRSRSTRGSRRWLSGAGVVSGGDEERSVAPGMRADDQELVILATITPRPGTR